MPSTGKDLPPTVSDDDLLAWATGAHRWDGRRWICLTCDARQSDQCGCDCCRLGARATRFFGQRWDAPRVDDAVQVPTPVGRPCSYCKEPVQAGDRGLLRRSDDGLLASTIEPVHAECELLDIFGHDFGICGCTGYDHNRASARLVWNRVFAGREPPLES